MEKLYQMIEAQQKGRENTPAWMIGEQLKEMAEREPACAELLEKDLVVEGMSLAAAEKNLKKYSDENHKGAGCFCITPKVAEKILREFYGLPDQGKEPEPEAPKADYIDLASFL